MFDGIIGIMTFILALVILLSKVSVGTKVILCGIVFVLGELASKFFNGDGHGGNSL